MSSMGVFDLKAAKAKGLAEKKTAVQLSGPGVFVPMGYAAMIPAGCHAYNWIATTGLGPCIGVLVVGTNGVGLAHITSDSNSFLERLVAYAIGTISNLTTIAMSSSGTKATEEIFLRLKTPLVAALRGSKVLEFANWDLGYSLKHREVVTAVSTDVAETSPVKGVPYWNLESVNFSAAPMWPPKAE
jgi:hypothetical protein